MSARGSRTTGRWPSLRPAPRVATFDDLLGSRLRRRLGLLLVARLRQSVSNEAPGLAPGASRCDLVAERRSWVSDVASTMLPGISALEIAAGVPIGFEPDISLPATDEAPMLALEETVRDCCGADAVLRCLLRRTRLLARARRRGSGGGKGRCSAADCRHQSVPAGDAGGRARLAGTRPRSPRIGAAGRRRGHGRSRCNRHAGSGGSRTARGRLPPQHPYGQPSVASRCGRQLAPGNGRRRAVRLPPLGAPQRSARKPPPASA